MPACLSPLLDPARIALHVQSTQSADALHEIAGLLEEHPDVTDFEGFYRELLAREQLDTTCVGNDVALPHSRTPHVRRIVLAVGRSDAGVFFENDRQTARLLFVLGTPQSSPGDYLNVVGALCRLLKDAGNRQALLRAATPDEFIAAVAAAEKKMLAPA